MGIINVGIADLNIARSPDVLATYALGSCVGICLYDERMKLAGLAHIMLPDSKAMRAASTNKAKFADTGIEELVRQMEAKGARKSRMVAKIAGGATMFAFQGKADMVQVGLRNAEACVAKLKELGIPILARDTGENYGRTVIFYPETGDYVVRAVGKPEKTI